MEKCLITKLKGRVSNNELLKLGEMRFYFLKDKVSSPKAATRSITLTFTEDTTISITGGHFTDSDLVQNLGTTLHLNKLEPKAIYVSNEEGFISVNKYQLKDIKITDIYLTSKIYFNIDDLKYSNYLTSLEANSNLVNGDIASLQNLTKLKQINLSRTKVSGDISVFSDMTNLSYLNLDDTQVSGDISVFSDMTNLSYLNLDDTQVSGDISVFSDMTNLSNLILADTQVSGDIASLQNLTKLKQINLSRTKVSGDISVFSDMTNLYELRLTIRSSDIVGEVSSLPGKIRFYTASRSNNLTWNGTRESSKSIFGIESANLGSFVDRMLINLAACTDMKISSDPTWYNTFAVAGTRTSASDAAVQTLQSKGYTVSITPA